MLSTMSENEDRQCSGQELMIFSCSGGCNVGQIANAAERTMSKGDRSSRWVASDALRELRSPAVLERLNNRQMR